ncbi:NAD-dependent protein deacylase [Lactobacillus acetotolerans]|jgi:NAD-dependent deacetylase|uniref:NAD-dependent deacetylase n=1 Tax=Lactobacillus acetotolerans TaxID=1600 RepID=A0A0D6A1B5_9LACO|nr:NAD-dependent protein deacylase [Lactobacillus acetotolerans]MBN7276656.1 NAD-dependent protein deacylase [Lactobacillus acetotolerans]QGV05238.1 NAD-dependent protein deacylase [Lactobacillus acetotolerans]QJD72725.1 NAD-dependent protein deacylase [Lactobacillus acetotolerans]BAQ56526.1 NAD-dependent deacetylase [Lactobacillus acetotolerans]HBQ42994.1 NAD-dependent protein deacylase [Lactobacillus acetotolerans]
MTDSKQITALKEDIKNAKHVVFLTGAGVSTHSGIPDYRSKNGIYNGVSESPETILSEDTLFNRPDFFYKFVMNNMYFPHAKPNLIHQKITEICNEKGSLITQNVDGLDKKSGNKDVTEFHGSLYNIYCTKCHKPVSYEEYAKSYRHENCGGIIRPGIVLYGEAINPENLSKSVNAMQNSDLVIISGTSFVVYPFAQLLAYRQAGAKVWAINKTEIPAAGINSIIGDALDVFKQL